MLSARWPAARQLLLTTSRLKPIANDLRNVRVENAGEKLLPRPIFFPVGEVGLVRIKCGVMLVIEVKGEESDETRAKHKFLDEWVRAINQSNGFGQWKWALVTDLANVDAVLKEAAALQK